MFNPTRGGTRGGQAEFKWADVSADKDRENYLGHSINAPTGRWQKNKDVHWYARDKKDTEAERAEEIRKIKEAEEDALAVALGFKPAVRVPQSVSGTNGAQGQTEGSPPDVTEKEKEKEEKRRRKEERRAQKAERRERRTERRRVRGESPSGRDRPRRRDSRSLSPVVRDRGRRHSGSDDSDRDVRRDRSREPFGRRRSEPRAPQKDYDEEEMRRERERDRARWEENASRMRAGTGVWGRD